MGPRGAHAFGRECTCSGCKQHVFPCTTFRMLFFAQTSSTAVPTRKIQINKFVNVSATVIHFLVFLVLFVRKLDGGPVYILVLKRRVTIYKEWKSLDNLSIVHSRAFVSYFKYDNCFKSFFACRKNEFHGCTLFFRSTHHNFEEQKRGNTKQRRITMRFYSNAVNKGQSPKEYVYILVG